MMRRLARKIHRWTGFFVLGFTLFYAVTGVMLNHRRAFGYFLTRKKQTRAVRVPDPAGLARTLAAYEKACGEKKKPTVVRIKNNGAVELLYGSHGVVTYIFRPGAKTMERVEKVERQPLYRLNRLHKAAKTSAGWLAAADLAGLLIFIAAASGLFLLQPRRRGDWLALGCGMALFVIMVVSG